MKVIRIGTRGYFFVYTDIKMDQLNEPVNVYVINGPKHLFVCDTHLGPEIMEEVFGYLEGEGLITKPVIVFNSHYDMDHVWGNCFFESIDQSMIISHATCRKILLQEGEEKVEQFAEKQRGDVKLVLPDVVFEKRLVFEEDGVEFYHTPGHTKDSSSCIDQVDKVLFVGDNILQEFIPYLERSDIDDFMSTMDDYLELDVNTIVGTHIEVMSDKTRVKELRNYMENFSSLTVNTENFNQHYKLIHYNNSIVHARSLLDLGNGKEALGYFKVARQTLEDLDPSEGELQKQIDDAKQKADEAISEILGGR